MKYFPLLEENFQDTTPGGGSSSAPGNFVLRPGGVATNNIYTDWTTLYAALSAQGGVNTVYIDDSIVTPAVITAGAYDLTNVTLAGTETANFSVSLQVDDGVTFTGFYKVIDNLFVTFLNTAPVETISTQRGMFLDNSVLIAGGSAPIFVINSNQVNWILTNLSGIGGGTPAIAVNPTFQHNFNLIEDSTIDPDMITGDATTALQVNFIDASDNFGTQSGFLGTITKNNFQNTNLMIYGPAVPTDWAPAPVTPDVALDQLAARITALGTPFTPFTNVLFVDKAAVGTPNGSIQHPYTTIQAAINVIPTAVSSATSKTVWHIVISPDTYDEDLTIDVTGKRIVLTGWGTWNLGVFNATNWLPSGTRRNITLTGNGASIDSIRTGLTITSFNQVGQRYSTNQSYINGPRISGQILFDCVSASSFEFVCQAEIFGSTGTTAGNSISCSVANPNPIIQAYFYSGRFRGKVNMGTNSNLQHAENVRFEGLLTTPNYSLVRGCRLDGGMTVTTATNAGVFPEGLINTYFSAGTFTGPLNSLRCDGNTNYWIITNGITLAGGVTTKTIQDNLTP